MGDPQVRDLQQGQCFSVVDKPGIKDDTGQDELGGRETGLWNPDANLAVPMQFSKEKYILDSSPEKLHKELEEELKLSSTDLRSHAWYHGRIPREVSRPQAGISAPDPSTHALANPTLGSSHQTVSVLIVGKDEA